MICRTGGIDSAEGRERARARGRVAYRRAPIVYLPLYIGRYRPFKQVRFNSLKYEAAKFSIVHLSPQKSFFHSSFPLGIVLNLKQISNPPSVIDH